MPMLLRSGAAALLTNLSSKGRWSDADVAHMVERLCDWTERIYRAAMGRAHEETAGDGGTPRADEQP